MSESSLHELSRESLIEEARKLGLVRPEVFTRAELQDEIVKRRVTDPRQRQRARGLLGLARDLLASVVEKGLHLPEVAEKLRAASPPPVPPPREPMATVTLAEIYVAQGHTARAEKILEEVLTREPEHAAARALRDKLVEAPSPVANPVEAPVAPPAVAAAPRPAAMLDEVPLPARYGVEEVVAMPVDPTTALVYWETRRAPADSVVELEIVHPLGQRELRTIPVGAAVGEHLAHDLPLGARVTARLGHRRDVAVSPRAVAAASVPSLAASPRVARQFSRYSGDTFVAVREAPSARLALSLALADADVTPSSPSGAPVSLSPTPRVPPGGSSEQRPPLSGAAPLGSSGLSLRLAP